jgi:hypothetical protein
MASQNARMEDQIAVCRLFAAYLKVQCEWSCVGVPVGLGQTSTTVNRQEQQQQSEPTRGNPVPMQLNVVK